MASLPNKPFMFNYNSRDYNQTTHTFPKTPGQLFDQDIVLTSLATGDDWPTVEADGSVNFNKRVGNFMGYTYNSIAENPFNRTSSNPTLTFIYKTKNFSSGGENLFANRASVHNYMVRGAFFHGQSPQLQFDPSTNPQIIFVRVDANGNGERKEVDIYGNVITAVIDNVEYGDETDGIAFFAGYCFGTENFSDIFYWMYCTNEVLSDAEIAKVIAFNENLPTFEVDTDNISASYQGNSYSVTLTADANVSWSATTVPAWVSLSDTAGTGTTVITLSVAPNYASAPRSGVVEFTSENDDTAQITITQSKYPILIPNNNIYLNGSRIN